MKATVYFLKLDRERFTGWDSKAGDDYHAARDDAEIERGLYEKAATIINLPPHMRDVRHDMVYNNLQNLDEPWTEGESVRSHTDFPRSMSMGDFIIYENEPTKAYVVASVGFVERDVPPKSLAAFETLLDRYQDAAMNGRTSEANRLAAEVEFMADEIGFDDHHRLLNIHTAVENALYMFAEN